MGIADGFQDSLQRAANLTLTQQESKGRELDYEVRKRQADDDLVQRNHTKDIQEAMAAGYKDWLTANPDAITPSNAKATGSDDPNAPAYTSPVSGGSDAPAAISGSLRGGTRSPVDKMDGYLAGLDAGVSAALKTGNNDLVRKQFTEATQLRGMQIQKAFQAADRDFAVSGDPSVYVDSMNKYSGGGNKLESIKANPDGTYALSGTDPKGNPVVHVLTTPQFQQSMDILRDPNRFLDARMKGLEMSMKARAEAEGEGIKYRAKAAAEGITVKPGEKVFLPTEDGRITKGRVLNGQDQNNRFTVTRTGDGTAVRVDNQTGDLTDVEGAPKAGGASGAGKPLNAQQLLTAKEKAGAVVRALRGNPIQGFDESSQVSTARLSARASAIIDEQNEAGKAIDPDVAANMAYDEMVRKKKLDVTAGAPTGRKLDNAPDPTKIPFFQQRN